MKTIKFFQHKNLVLLAFIVFSVSACGGGGGGDGGGGTLPPNSDVSAVRILALAQTEEGSDGSTTPMNFTVRLDSTNSEDITVDYAIQDVTTEGTDDIVTSNGTLTIPAGALEVTLPIDIVADTAFELNEIFTVELSNPSSNATIGNSQATGTIVNDDSIPITIDIVDIVPGNDITLELPSAEFDLLIDLDAIFQDIDLQNLIDDMQIDIYIDDGFNIPVLLHSFNLNLIVDQTSPYRIFFQFPPGYESGLGVLDLFRFEITMLNSSGEPIPESSVNVINRPVEAEDIQNFTRLEVSDGAVFTEGASGETTTMTFTASLSNADGSGSATLANTVTLDYITVLNDSPVSSPATPDEDFAHVSGSVTIPAGETQATFDVEVFGDDEAELIETFYVYLDHDSNEVVMVQRRAVGAIHDDDVAPDFRTITVSDVQIDEGDVGTTEMQFEVTLDQPADTPVSFTYSTEADIGVNPAQLSDYQEINNASEEFATGEQSKIITVLINGDTDPENDETLLLRITSSSSNSQPFGYGRGTILSDDPLTQVSISDVTQSEGADGEIVSFGFIVSLSNPLQADLVIDYNTVDGTATIADSDYTSATESITIAQGDTAGTITVPVNGDNNPEPDEVFNVVINTSSNAAQITDDTANGVILNDDSSGWSGEELVQRGGASVWPRLAFGPNGERHVIYRDSRTIESTVSTVPTVWSAPVPIGTTHSNASVQSLVPHVVIDNNGDGVAVWRNENDVVSSSILTAGSWATATMPESVEATGQINMANNPATGDAIMVWQEPANDGNNNFKSIRAGHYDPTNGWQSINFIETTDGHASIPEIAMNANGKTIAVFTQTNATSGTTDVLAYEYNGSNWIGLPELDDTANTEVASWQKIAMNEAGDVAVVWQQRFGSPLLRSSIYLNRYDAGTAQWSAAMLVETQDSFNAAKPDVTIDMAGNVFVVWEQGTSDLLIKELMVRRYDATLDDWSSDPVTLVSEVTGTTVISSQQVVADDQGNAIAIWVQNDGIRNNLRSARYSFSDNAWQPADLLEASNTDIAWFADIVIDRISGNAMVVWGNVRPQVWANRYTRN